jgi:hypothetical protein
MEDSVDVDAPDLAGFAGSPAARDVGPCWRRPGHEGGAGSNGTWPNMAERARTCVCKRAHSVYTLQRGDPVEQDERPQPTTP